MFKGLKNKIREETGNDISRIAPVLTGGTQKSGAIKGRHSRQGSTSSIGSLSFDSVQEENGHLSAPLEVSEDPNNDDVKASSPKELKQIEKKEEECKKRILKIENEWKRKLEEKEREWKLQLEVREKEKSTLEKSKLDLQEALSEAEDYKKKYFAFQEEKEQLDGFQMQEIAKVKHLLLAKERELSKKADALKESQVQIGTLRSEVSRLRRFEEELSNIQDEFETHRHSSEQERASLRCELAQSEENVRHLHDRVAVLERRTSADCMALGAPLSIDERVQGLLGERTLLERRLEEAHLHLADIKSSWSSKITSLETQVGRLCRQAGEEGAERRRAEAECLQLQEKVQQLEIELATASENSTEKDSLAQENELLRDKLDAAIREKDEVMGHLSESKSTSELEIRRLKEELENERFQLTKLQEKSEADWDRLNTQLADVQKTGRAGIELLRSQLSDAKKEIEVQRLKCSDLLHTVDQERAERDNTLIRNAEVSLQVEMSNQLLRSQETEMADLHMQIETLESLITSKEQDFQKLIQENSSIKDRLQELEQKVASTSSSQEREHQEFVAELEAQILEKNKSIKQLQQRLGDMKKTLQRELKLPPGGILGDSGISGSGSSGMSSEDTAAPAAVLAPSSSHQVSQRRLQQQAGASSHSEDYHNVNFQYLKHVLIKFLTSREYEAKHLTRAVATLLHFSPEEERLLRETLEWKMSWFGSRPNLGIGQTAKTINPS